MANKITKEFLQEYFRKHDSITLYKADGTSATFSKQHHIRLYGGHRDLVFKDYDEFLAFCAKQHLRQKPVPITVI
jgi:6-phosphogluconolactonase (cycloisomerase 2 family)